MKYLVIGAITLVMTLLVSKVLLAVNLDMNKFNSKESITKQDTTDEFINTGKSTYMVYCSSCHGKNGKGNKDKAQDHTKRMSKKSILDVINNGANNFKNLYPSGMPAGLIKDQTQAEEVAQFVANALKGEAPKAWSVCASCHDSNGKGISFVAPNIKTYSDELVTTVLLNGKKGVIGTMPSFEGRLSHTQMKALAAYIRSIQE